MVIAPSNLGIVGLGLLGSALADRLLRHGFHLVGYDIDAAKCAALAEQGSECGLVAADVFARCDVLLLSLPTSGIVAATLQHASRALRSGQTIIDTTTGDPGETIDIAVRLQQRGIHYIEARVCGSSEHVRRGEATLLLGGDVERIASLHNVLQAISSRVFHLGEVGSASQFKLVHNLILGLNRAVLAEGLQFARSLGFDAASALAILLETPAASRAMESKGRKMLSADYEPQATLAQHLKDVELIVNEADKSGAVTPLSQLHRKLLQQAMALGFGNSDNSAIIEAFAKPVSDGRLVTNGAPFTVHQD